VVTIAASDAIFSLPVNQTALESTERKLNLSLPFHLREILLECGSVTADCSSGVIWSISDILVRNLEFRSMDAFRELYMPFNHLLFFGDDGGGDQFAFPIHADGKIHKPDIYRWEHETDSRSWFASDRKQYFERRFKNDFDT